jgi:hypothetical protein
MQTRVSLIALTSLALLGGAAYGKEKCSNATLNGTYGLYATGTVIGVGPVGLVGVLKYDGRGAFTGTVFQKVNGNLVQFTVTGTYTIDSNCISTDVSLTSTGQSATHTVVIVDNGNEFYSLNTTPSPGNIIVGIGKRQFAGDDDSGDDR